MDTFYELSIQTSVLPASGNAVKTLEILLKSMTKHYNFDDVNLEEEYWHEGDPIRFTNPEIMRMLSLAKAGKDDVFCDFGCGFGQTVIMALHEFGVKKAIGVESDDTRAWGSGQRLEELGLSKKGEIIFGPFEDLEDTFLRKVTILFYGLSGGTRLFRDFRGYGKIPRLITD